MKSNLQYWQGIYTSSEVPTYPSQFAVFVQSWLGSEQCNLLELGCGNGRDSIFLSNAGHNVVVTDQCIGTELQEICNASENMNFIEDDVVNAVNQLESYIDLSQRTVVYSRFFQHAIDGKKENEVMTRLGKKLPEDSILFFEFRLAEDENQFKVFGTDHYRRFQSENDFENLLHETDFTCEYQCKGQGYARYGNEDPIVGRFVAKPVGRFVAKPSAKVKLRMV